MSPVHIGQDSLDVYRVHPFKDESGMALNAARITFISACAVASWSRVVVLNPRTTMAPSLTMTAP